MLLFNLTGDRDPNHLLKPIMVCANLFIDLGVKQRKKCFIITFIPANKSVIISDVGGHCTSPNQQMFLCTEMTSHTPNPQIKLEGQGVSVRIILTHCPKRSMDHDDEGKWLVSNKAVVLCY